MGQAATLVRYTIDDLPPTTPYILEHIRRGHARPRILVKGLFNSGLTCAVWKGENERQNKMQWPVLQHLEPVC